MFYTKDQDVLSGIMLVECDHSYERLIVTFALDLMEMNSPRASVWDAHRFKPSRKANIK